MSQPIVSIQGIGKRYSIGAAKEPYLTLRGQVAKRFSSTARRARVAEQEFWALRDISFSMEPGEAVGVIGRNGAGKSTLLKVLSQITPPTEGKITMRGRVGSLLEVGTGFHPELTGRENIYMNGAILGMGRKEITRRFDEIVAFAEVEKFLDTPVKRYSSGMYVRLAFAVAAHLEPEILVVDEVLAVGDAEFQAKCLARMGDSARSGRTVVLVSHNMAAVGNLCHRAILFDRGRLVADGASQEIIEQYLHSRAADSSSVDLSVSPGRLSWAQPWIRTARVGAPDGGAEGQIAMGDDLVIEVDFSSPDGGVLKRPVFRVNIVSMRLGKIASVNNHLAGQSSDWPPMAEGTLRCIVRRPPLLPGDYQIDLDLGDSSRGWVDCVPSAVAFRVVESDLYGTGKTPNRGDGVLYLDAQFDAIA